MATITDLARKDTRAGSNGSWRAETYPQSYGYVEHKGLIQRGYREVWHYSTLMLRYGYETSYEQPGPLEWDQDLNTVYASTGNGSVSDQHGMNQLFRALGMPLNFSRAGGAVIDRTDRRVG